MPEAAVLAVFAVLAIAVVIAFFLHVPPDPHPGEPTRHYPDDRHALAYVYDGTALMAVVYDEREVNRYREETPHYVDLTPVGAEQVGGGQGND